jgi:predicted DCC family thiol-disulfide oxidoreductase YuxK
MDATCGICAKGARWIAHNDSQQEFRIIPLQSDLGHALMRHHGLDPQDPTSWLYLQDGLPYEGADAVIRVAQRLGGKWRILGALRIIPAGLLHHLYLVIARNRYRLSGRADLCNLPDPAIQARLLQPPARADLETTPASDL